VTAPVPPPSPPRAAEQPRPEPRPLVPEPAGRADEFLSSDTLAKLDEPPATAPAPWKPGEPAADTSPPPVAASLPADDAATNRSRLIFARLADVVVVVLLLVAGMFVGELVVRKSTSTILEEAGSAPKFPPVDLLLWLGCVAFFPLIYAWLGTRGWTLGTWLRRKED
jgi:hypothetical protein